jgi:outer membrane murein-binding lipoprotein Lpp
MRALGTALAAAILASTALAGSGAQKNSDGVTPEKPAPTAQQIEDLTRAVKTLGDSIKADIAKLNERATSLDEKLDQELRALKARGMTTDLNVASAQRDINDFRDQLNRIRQDMDAMRGRATEQRIAGYNALGAGTQTARVRLVNTYFQPVSVVVNGWMYQLQPGQERFATFPAGSFTYEVLGIASPQQRTLTAGETFTVEIYPRM